MINVSANDDGRIHDKNKHGKFKHKANAQKIKRHTPKIKAKYTKDNSKTTFDEDEAIYSIYLAVGSAFAPTLQLEQCSRAIAVVDAVGGRNSDGLQIRGQQN